MDVAGGTRGGVAGSPGRLRVWIVPGLLLAAALSSLVLVPAPARAYTPRGPILIDGDADFTAANGVTGGSGTPSDPYIIDGWEPGGIGHRIEIRNTTAHFVVQNVNVHGGYPTYDGIHLANVTNGAIRSVVASTDYAAVRVLSSDNVNVSDSAFSGGAIPLWYGVWVESSADIRVANNTFAQVQRGVFVRASSDVLVASNRISAGGLEGIRFDGVVRSTAYNNTVAAAGWDAIALDASPNAVLWNNTVTGSWNGISVSSDDVTLLGNNVSGNRIRWPYSGQSGRGIALNAARATLWGNTLASDGVFLGPVTALAASHTIPGNNTVNGRPIAYYANRAGLTVDGAAVGQLLVANCTGVRVTNLSVSDADVAVQLASVHDAVIASNTLTANEFYGVWAGDSSNVTIAGNTLAGNGVAGARVEGSEDVTIRGNRIVDGSYYGADVWYSDRVAVVSNVMTSLGVTCVFAYRSGNVSVVGNVASDCASEAGIHVSYVANATIEGNRISASRYGIIVNASRADVARNVVNGSDTGIEVQFASPAVVHNNNVSGNQMGVSIEWSSGDQVFHNNFLGNVLQAADTSGPQNAWDAGYPSGGNYWSDYLGVDDCSGPNQDVCPNPDGIGDSPYGIDADSQDRYPLMAPAPVFIDLPPVVVLNAPDGGERYSGGFPQDIVWTMSDPDTTGDLLVTLEVSTDGGVSYAPIAVGLSLPQGQNRYTWDLPSVDTGLARVRVLASDGNSSASDASASDFTIDSTPPRVVSVDPAESRTNVPLSPPIRVVFSEPMELASLLPAFSLSPAVGGLRLTLGGAGEVLTVTHDPFAACTPYTATIGAGALDLSSPGNPIGSSFAWAFTTTCNPVAGITSPAGGASWTGGSRHDIVWTMSSQDASLRVDLNYSQDGGADGYPFPVFSGTLATGTVRLPWTVPRLDAADVRLRLAVTDASGGVTVVESETFTIDSTPPSVLSVSPADGARGVAVDEDIRIVFGGTVNRTSAEAALVLAPDPGGIAFRWEVTGSGDDVLVVSHGPFPPGVAYQVRVGSSLRDDSDPGNPLAAEFSAGFATATANPPPSGSWDLLWLVLGGSGVAFASMWAFEPSRVALLTLFLAGVHRRRLDDDPESEVRGMVRGYIQVRPGDAYTDIRRNLALNNGALTYHLQRLERDGVIKSRIRDGRKRYYPVAAVIPVRENGELCEVQRQLIGTVAHEPGLSVAVLAGKFGISSQLALYHLRALARGKYISLERRGIRLRAFPGGRAAPPEPAPPRAA